MKTFALSIAAVLVVGAAALSITPTAGAQTAGPQTPSCGTFKVLNDETIDGREFPKGTYQLNAFGISCGKVRGTYGLFDQFLSQDATTPLPKPWQSLAGAVGAPKFTAGPGVGFRAQRISS
jgi:hypothetical protein